MAEENTPPPANTPPANTPLPFDFAAHGIAGDDLGYVQNKGFKGPGDMVTAYRNLESFVGDRESLIRLPKERTPENMRKDVWSKLGAGELPDYEKAIPALETDKSGFSKTAATWFHEHGVPVETAKAIAAKFNEHGASLVKSMNDATVAEHKDQLLTYQKERGAAWADTLKMVDTVAQTFQMSAGEVEGLKATMGPVAAIKLLERIGTKLGTETSRIEGEGGDGKPERMTPEGAKQRIKELNADENWSKRFLSGDFDARKESERLHKMAYPDS